MPDEAHATDFVELYLGMRKGQEHATHFGKREGGQEHATHFGKREGGQEHATHFVKSHPFSLLVFIAPISVLGCLGAGPRLSLSPFWVILGWFLFSFSPKIGQSNTNFC
jgi:hypothetical protein